MADTQRLYILWTSGDVMTSLHMVLMYAKNSLMKGWWQHVTVIVWGAAAQLASENEAVQEEIQIAQHVGVEFSACVACARRLGVIEKLEGMGMEVIAWGEPLTELIKDGAHMITV